MDWSSLAKSNFCGSFTLGKLVRKYKKLVHKITYLLMFRHQIVRK
jgi:hypothetical protein